MDKIDYTWKQDPITDITTDIVPSKNSDQKYYKITQTDNLYNIIEEHMVILSNTKSGAFYWQFETWIDEWENSITVISEVLEILL